MEYGAELETKNIHVNGCISFRGDPIFISNALAGETVALEPQEDPRFVDIYFSDFHIGTFDSVYATTRDVSVERRTECNPSTWTPEKESDPPAGHPETEDLECLD